MTMMWLGSLVFFQSVLLVISYRPLRTNISPEFRTPIPANFTLTWYKQKVRKSFSTWLLPNPPTPQLDHFNYLSDQTFDQRVIISTDHWCKGCPIFFYCGNEGDIFEFANNTGFMWEKAQEFRAMVIFVEHRYYGQSLPFGPESLKVSKVHATEGKSFSHYFPVFSRKKRLVICQQSRL